MARPDDHVVVEPPPTPSTESISSSADINTESAYNTSSDSLTSSADPYTETTPASFHESSPNSNMAHTANDRNADSAVTGDMAPASDISTRPAAAITPTSKKPRVTFFGLPRELRDEIYDLAFIEGPNVVGIMDYSVWYGMEVERRHAILSVRFAITAVSSLFDELTITWPGRVHPPPPVWLTRRPRPFNNMLVSKQFFDEASTLWARHKTIDLGNLSSLGAYGYRHRSGEKWPITMQKATVVWDMDSPFRPVELHNLDQNLSLKTLEVTVGDQVMFGLGLEGQKFAWSDTYTEEEFAETAIAWTALRLPGLESIKFIAGQNTYTETPQEQARWEDNIAALENFLQKKLLERETNSLATGTIEGQLEGEQDEDEDEDRARYGVFRDMDQQQLAKLAIIIACVALAMGALGPVVVCALFLKAR